MNKNLKAKYDIEILGNSCTFVYLRISLFFNVVYLNKQNPPNIKGNITIYLHFIKY